ncbi:MAG TPA: SDR family oxidoreductase [Chthoniobacterales bacterium]|nr:SDR family oxidoreductase [Chthoniobacterales bacterium]
MRKVEGQSCYRYRRRQRNWPGHRRRLCQRRCRCVCGLSRGTPRRGRNGTDGRTPRSHAFTVASACRKVYPGERGGAGTNPDATYSLNVSKRRSGNVRLGRPGQPEEVAPSYVFLASEDSSYMTGRVLHPNGGTVVNG